MSTAAWWRAVTNHAYQGSYAARFSDGWADWSRNNLRQDLTCRSSEWVHVTGKGRINRLTKGGADWVGCGVKIEPTAGGASTKQAFNETSPPTGA